ncbi:MAG TPA: serine/threonine-protein kinase [Isosphaeraceae bacterium]|jgi:serine/threonine protein kinase|nr:serine/threonine-protein kinase [Isosphaeraceae bacterium]
MIIHEENSATPDCDDPVLDDLVEEYLRRREAGEPIMPEAFARAHPEEFDRLRGLLPALAAVAAFCPSSPRLGDDGPPELDLIATVGTLGDYRLIREVGRGGMGVVYEAEQLSLGRRVALKVLPFAAALDSRQRQRFQTEAHAAACLHHTHIVPVYTVGCDRGVYYYAMQFIEGRSLAALIQDLRQQDTPGAEGQAGPDLDRSTVSLGVGDGRLPTSSVDQSPGTPLPSASSRVTRARLHFRLVARLGAQAAEALQHSHEQGILHRDVKPSNLLVDDRGELWITDFGLARLVSDSGLTTTGALLGTLRYMSPEQAQARHSVVDHRTDIYSLGATLYELLTLHSAFDARDRHELLRQIAQDEPPSPRRVAPAIPRDLETIVLKAMAKDPTARYDSMGEMADDLGRFLDDKPIRARRPGPIERSVRWANRHLKLVISTVLFLLLALAGLGVGSALIWQEKQRTDREKRRTEQNLTLALQALDRFCLDLAEKDYFQAPDRAKDVLKLQDDALQLYVHLVYENPTDRQVRWEAARAYRRVADIRLRLGQQTEAEQAHLAALRLLERLVVEQPGNPAFQRERIEVLLILGAAKWGLSGQPSSEAKQRARKALELARSLVHDHPTEPGARLALAESLSALGSYFVDESRSSLDSHLRFPPKAQAMLLEARDILLEAREILDSLISDEAVRREGCMTLIQTYSSLGQCYRFSRHPVEAEEAFGRAVRELEILSHESPSDYKHREHIARIYSVLCCPWICPPDKDPQKAERHYRRALDAWLELSHDFPRMARFSEELAGAHQTMAALHTMTGHVSEAEVELRQAADIYQKLTSDFPALKEYSDLQANIRLQLVSFLILAGKIKHAAQELALAASNLSSPEVSNQIAWILATTPGFGPKEHELAVKLGKEIIAAKPDERNYWNTLGVALYRLGAWTDARSALERSMHLCGGGDPYDWYVLAMVEWQLDHKDQARQWFDHATQNKPKDEPRDDLRCLQKEAQDLIGRLPPAEGQTPTDDSSVH